MTYQIENMLYIRNVTNEMKAWCKMQNKVKLSNKKKVCHKVMSDLKLISVNIVRTACYVKP